MEGQGRVLEWTTAHGSDATTHSPNPIQSRTVGLRPTQGHARRNRRGSETIQASMLGARGAALGEAKIGIDKG
eukprot:11927909-Alexandrium_andersonii.AAC.1